MKIKVLNAFILADGVHNNEEILEVDERIAISLISLGKAEELKEVTKKAPTKKKAVTKDGSKRANN